MSPADSSLFLYAKDGVTIFTLVYINNIIMTRTCSRTLQSIISSIQSKFMLKDLGTLEYFLSMKRNGHRMAYCSLNKSIYMICFTRPKWEIVRESQHQPPQRQTNSHARTIIFETNTISQHSCGLQYLTLTHPEVCFSVHKVFQFLHASIEANWSSIKRILRYLKLTSSHGLLLTKSKILNLNVYTDADGEIMWMTGNQQ